MHMRRLILSVICASLLWVGYAPPASAGGFRPAPGDVPVDPNGPPPSGPYLVPAPGDRPLGPDNLAPTSLSGPEYLPATGSRPLGPDNPGSSKPSGPEIVPDPGARPLGPEITRAAANRYWAGDYAGAVRLWRHLAEQGDPNAQGWLGSLYFDGQGVLQDYKTAAEWFRKAAMQGSASSQSSLGDMYYKGQGVPQDYVQAHVWFNLAAVSSPDAWSREAAAKKRETVSSQMMPAQIFEAQARARDWEPISSGTTIINASTTMPRRRSVSMVQVGGTYAVPVGINNVITLDFIVDSGAAYVSIPSDVVSTLVRSGTLQASDFIGQETFVLADGSQVPSATFRIRSLKVGDLTLENVVGNVANAKGSLLLGQSFLGRFQSWSIDNASHALMLGSGNP